MLKRKAYLFLMVTSGICLPLTCVPISLLLNSWNPMQVAFITSFEVENKLSQDIWITPVGTVGSAGYRSTLPIFRNKWPAISSSTQGNLHMSPGGIITIYYDWDDINFSEILIRTSSWRKVLVIDPEPTKDQYRRYTGGRIVIDETTALVDPSPQIQEAVSSSSSGSLWYVVLVGLAAPCIFIYSRRQYRIISNASAITNKQRGEVDG